MDTFETAIALRQVADGSFAWTVPNGWQQGRGAWGGLVVGAIVRAVEASEPDAGRVVRSINASLVAPAVVGDHHIQTHAVRRGSAVATWSATVTSGAGEIVATATVILGSARTLASHHDYDAWSMLERPAAPPAGDVPVLVYGPPLGPVFVQHVEARVVTGVPGEAGLAETTGWIDYAQPVARSAASLLALVDAWWPASLVAMSSMSPIATVSFAANLVIDPAEVPEGEPLLHDSLVTSAAEGYTSEHRRLWTSGGRLVVDNLQSIVLIA